MTGLAPTRPRGSRLRRTLAVAAAIVIAVLPTVACDAKTNGTNGQSGCSATSDNVGERVGDKKTYLRARNGDGDKVVYAEAFVLRSTGSNKDREFIVCVHNFSKQERTYTTTASVDKKNITRDFTFTYGPGKFATFTVIVVNPGCLDLVIEGKGLKAIDDGPTKNFVCPKKLKT